MGRRIVASVLQASDIAAARGEQELDSYFDRVVKYIPTDIIGAWLVVKTTVSSGADESVAPIAFWILFGVFLTLTFWWTNRQTYISDRPSAVLQCVISTVAFAVWVMAIGGGPFDTLSIYQPWIGSIILVVFTLVSGRIVPSA